MINLRNGKEIAHINRVSRSTKALQRHFDAEYYARDGHGQWQYHGLRHGGDDFDSDSDSGSDSDSSG